MYSTCVEYLDKGMKVEWCRTIGHK
jgi:hypothetical protein